jgi:hypothetical protein
MAMSVEEARAEGQRWLDDIERRAEKALAVQEIARAVRCGEIESAEGKRRLRAIDDRATVYDGSKLADALKILIAASMPSP